MMSLVKALFPGASFSWSSFKGQSGHPKVGWHGRASAYLDESASASVSVEWAVPSRSVGVSFRVGHDDDAVAAHVGLGGAVFLSAQAEPLRRFRDWVCRVLPGDMGRSWSGRVFSLRVHDWAIWWSLGVDDQGWTSARPRWRDGSWRPLGWNMRRGEPRLVEERRVLVPMPERSYRGVAKRHEAQWGFTKLPPWFDRHASIVDIEMDPGEQIPIPGKGENSWDCDEDAIFGTGGGQAQTIEDAIGQLVASALRDRRRRSGDDWVPEARAKSKVVS